MIRKLLARFKRRYVYKISVTGKFVSKAFAEANPETTYRTLA